jgi:preprotein translocase subunit SecB
MSHPVIHLESYYLEKVLIERRHPKEEEESDQITLSFQHSYRVKRHHEDPRLFLLSFFVQDDPKAKTPHPQVYTLDIEILGIFRFDDDVEEEKMQWLIRYNGGAILYGILRGMVTNMTAAFPEGPVRIPTIMMDDVVKKVEGLNDKAPKKKAAKKAAKKRAKKVASKSKK